MPTMKAVRRRNGMASESKAPMTLRKVPIRTDGIAIPRMRSPRPRVAGEA
jgi:hypothetical protein